MSVLNKFHQSNGLADIKPKSLYDFFKEHAIYQIPLYQRPYSWEEVHVNTLLEDIKKARENEDDWFLGPIFTAAEHNDIESSRRIINLLDGQQRITTLYIIARVLYSLDSYFETGISGYSFSEDKNEEGVSNAKRSRKRNLRFLQQILLDDDPSEGLVCKFKTDLSSREVLNDWILGTAKIDESENEIEKNTKYKELKDLRVVSDDEFLITKKSLNHNIGFLYDYFENMAEKENGLEDLNAFTDFFLNKLYFIHIPLKEKNDVLDIFESINNRGKKLNLTDTLRFISIKSYINDENKQKQLDNEWSSFYKSVQSLNKYFNDSDVFLERYINSIVKTEDGKPMKNGLVKDFDRIEFFKREHSSNYLKGLKKINHCLDVIDFVFSNRFLDLIESKTEEEKRKVSGLIKLLQLVFEISQNSHVLFLGFLNRVFNIDTHQSMLTSPRLEGHKILLGFIWQFIKYVIAVEIYKDDDSNSVRGTFYVLAQTMDNYSIYDGTSSDLGPLLKINGKKEEYIRNLAFQKFSGVQKKETTLLLYYFQFLHQYSELDTSNEINYKSCDHIMPDKWYNKDCWKQDVLSDWGKTSPDDESSERGFHSKIDLNNKYVQIFAKYIEDLWDEKDSKESFIQLIGNKVYIPGGLNIRKSNRCWEDDGTTIGAKTIFANHLNTNLNSSFIIPSFPVFHALDTFELSTIIERTAFIVQTICENSDKRYGSV